MSITVGRFRPAHQPVSIVDISTGTQIEFDHPSDMLDWFERHPADRAKAGSFVWYTGPVNGGHP